MSTPSLALTSTDRSMPISQSASGTVVCVDFQAVAGLIDAVAGFDPVRLPALFTMIWETGYKLEARTVLRAAVACRDPLSDLGTICNDALRTTADLEKLVRAQTWQSIASVVGHHDPRSGALLGACDHEITGLTGPRQARHKAIRARLETAAQAERSARSEEILSYAAIRLARCPGIWQLYEQWRDKE